MARAMGIRSEWVDAMTFGLGSGIAGVAGVALSQLTNVGPNLGQAYIIDSFMVVVFGGVGNLWGTLIGGMSMGVVNKLLEPYAGAVLAKILVLVALILFIQRRPRGLFPQTGRAAESAVVMPGRRTWMRRPGGPRRRRVSGRARRGGDRRPAAQPGGPGVVAASTSRPTCSRCIGKYLCYAMLALAVDLIWGYCGILSLGHAAFFALGGYAHGHVSHAPDRPARRLRRSGPARLHGLPELEDAALVLAGVRPLLVCAR